MRMLRAPPRYGLKHIEFTLWHKWLNCAVLPPRQNAATISTMRFLIPLFLALFSLSACAPQAQRIASAGSSVSPPTWAFEASDVPLDPAYKFGRLANGMRYVIRNNATPKGTAAVRMEVRAGSLDEADSERGFAHFVEHMAFNGSTNVPEGEMVRLLERQGLAFGADTNAQTSFEQTTYMLDLPRNDPALLGTALMLMRETASELKFDPEAVTRERGVVLSEMRDRQGWQMRNLEDQLEFFAAGARYVQRLPIGTTEALNAASADSLRAFWRRSYVPAYTTVIVVGDFAVEDVETAIKKQFESWALSPAAPPGIAGPINAKLLGKADVFVDPALSERITASRNGPWQDEPDSLAWRQTSALREIGYAIINRRFQGQSRQADPPFRSAGFATSDIFKEGRSTTVAVDTVDGKWRRGLIAAVTEYRRAMKFGFTQAEIDEQLANIRTALQNGAASSSTRSHGALVNAVLTLLRDGRVPATPESSLAQFEAFAPQINPKRVFAALKYEAIPLTNPLLRFQGRRQPEGGERAILSAWQFASRQPLRKGETTSNAAFAYTQFGQPGSITSDSRDAALGIRQIRYANGVRLNIKQTDLQKDRINLQLSVDGGDMLNTKAQPLAMAMVQNMPAGGLGKHSQDQLQSILAGRTASLNLSSTAETFVSSAQTTPQDLELQLQLFAALLTDPGYRMEGEVLYKNSINTFFAQLGSTPSSALTAALSGILADKDPRFTLQPVEDYRKLSFTRLKADITDRLTKGAIELGMVGDLDEDKAIALVGKTLGGLPQREADFRPYEEQRSRPFTADRSPRTVRHTGPADQALLRITWPTRDDSDQKEVIALALLDRVVGIELIETLREKLGKAYSPAVNSVPSRVWRGYGTFSVAASVDVKEVSAVRAAIAETIARLRDTPISADELLRARQPLIEGYDNALKSNSGWMTLTDRAQTEPDQIARFQQAKTLLQALTADALQAMAQRYLLANAGVEVLVLPQATEPTQ
jgi:zinc protease